jgi:lipoprotein-anchoring transpeptidase ErfK/SrfK
MRTRTAGAIALGAIALAACGRATAVRFPKIPAATPAASAAPPPPPAPLVKACARPTLIGTVAAAVVTARTAPGPFAAKVASFSKMNAQGAQQVFDLQEAVTGLDGATWYRALLPMRPNGTTGFIPASAVQLSQTLYRIDVSQSGFRLTLWKGCHVIGRFTIGFGKIGTPTPVGRFYLISLMKPPTPDSVYGAYAFGLSAYSDAIRDWRWGGVIGLHGTNDPASIGKRMSHGCIRMRNRDIEGLARILPLGTPITIR